MITSEQVRAARAALGWSRADLARVAEVGERTLTTIETQHGAPDGRASTLRKIQRALEDAGIEFIGTPEDAPGIRLHKSARQR